MRTPTLIDRDIQGAIGPIPILGNNDFRSEDLLSFELGYRFFALDWMTAEVSAYWSEYDDASAVIGPLPAGPFVFRNAGDVEVKGAEVEITVIPVEWLRLTTGYSVMVFDEDTPFSPLSVPLKDSNPQHQVVVRSLFDLPMDLEFDAAVYWVDGLEAVVPTLRSNNVRQYVRLDLRLGWKPLDYLEISLVGQNLADARHAEYNDVQRNESTQVPRSGYAMVTVDF